ncbi:MAG TPA: sorbosone dehydrogenase family protein [Burkholderiales bacterium]|nr:sorbosone dehydrogenase family protein [Burkholderiales bacterium]
MKRLPLVLLCVGAAACAESSRLPEGADTGVQPVLAAPVETPIPTVKVAPAKGWPAGEKPVAAPGWSVEALATGLQHPRWLYVLPNGDVLVAETSAPERPEDGKGVKGFFMKQFMKRAGSAVPSANRISLLRGGVRHAFLEGLSSPFGMALVGNDFYVANTDAVLRFPYREGETSVAKVGEKVADLPGGPLNHHWTKNLLASRDGRHLYVTVGSNSNIAENGLDKEERRAAILELDAKTGATRVFASGLRNPNGLAYEPETGALWTVVNERDELGSDLVPDYLTSVRENGFYGWPWSYFGRHVDARVQPARPDLVEKAIVPDYALGAHVAPLGLAFAHGGAFVGNHGSWNRRPPSGYNVVFVPFSGGRPQGKPQVVLSGFLDAHGKARGRPVGVAVDRSGAILVADDVGNTVWRLTRGPAVAYR